MFHITQMTDILIVILYLFVRLADDVVIFCHWSFFSL